MASWKLKGNEMKIEFFSTEDNYCGLPHPIAASKVVPDWYKKMPRSRYPETDKTASRLVWADPEKGFVAGATIKECIPVRDYITAGYVIPLWASMVVHATDDGGNYFSWQAEDVMKVEQHNGHQTLGSPINESEVEHNTLKLGSPWLFKTPPGYSCLFFSPRYSEPQIEILPAIVDTDQQHEVNFPFVFRNNKDNLRDYVIERGTPIIQVLPFKRENWESEVKVKSEGFINGFNKFTRSFALGAYRKFRHQKKKYL